MTEENTKKMITKWRKERSSAQV